MKKLAGVLLLTLLAISGCQTSETQIQTAIVLTQSAMPTETMTPVPPAATATATATATLEPSPTPDPLLFKDEFDGALGRGWSWIREKNKYWSLTNNAGWLEIVARSGGIANGLMPNILLRQAPPGNFELETRLKFKPQGNYQIAGLLIYDSDANHIQFGRVFCDPCGGDGYFADLVADRKLISSNFFTKAPETDTVYLRLRREGNSFTGFASEDGKEWKLIGVHESGLDPRFVGLVAGQAYQSVPKPAQFDYFIITAIP